MNRKPWFVIKDRGARFQVVAGPFNDLTLALRVQKYWEFKYGELKIGRSCQ